MPAPFPPHRLLLPPWLAILLLLCPRAAAQGLWATRPDPARPVTLDAGRPKFHIPPDSPLARNQHPRLLLLPQDLPVLRARLADPRLARHFDALKRQAQRPWSPESAGATPALLFKLTGEARYLDAIRQSPAFRKPTWIFGWAAAIDLVWDDLTPAERRELSDAVAKAVAKDGGLFWRPTLHLVSTFYEGGAGPHDAAFLARLQHDFRDTLLRWTDKLNRWSAGRGGSDMGHGYNGEHAYWEPLIAALAWQHATGEDYLGRAAFARCQSPFYWYHLVPGLDPLCVEHLGVTRDTADPGAVTPAHCGANHLLFLTFTRERDGLGPAWMDKFATQEPAWNRDREALGRFLWWDPDLQPIDPATLPITRLFPTSGHVVMRSDWTDAATFATFRCGRFGEIDGAWGRNHADNLSFTIRKLGPLAIDSGPVHSQNAAVLKFPTKGGEAEIPAIGNYGRQTIAHNSITIGDGEYTHRDWRNQPTRDIVRRGGQSVPQARDWWKAWGFSAPQDDFGEGRITAYRTHPLYDYACGDARFSYPPEWGIQSITRQFVYLKPDVFVIFDRLTLADPAKTPCWLFHSLREPKAAGDEKALSPAEIGPQFVAALDQLIAHPSPGGHFTMEGDAFTVESGPPGKPGGGWLTVRTLFPASADCLRRKLGGRGHDFEVAGVQYGPTEEGYAQADSPYAARNTIGLLGWRVELRPKAPAHAAEFLHVLQVGRAGQGAEALRALTHRATPETHVLTIPHAGRTFTLTLARTGSRGGAMAVTGAGARVEHPLPGAVEDHYREYRDTPHYRAWTTDPRYRAVIGEEAPR